MNKILKRMKEIDERRGAIRDLIENASEEELDALLKELEELAAEYKTLEEKSQKRQAAIDELKNNPPAGNQLTNPVIENIFSEKRSGAGGIDSRAAFLADIQGINETETEKRAAEFAKSGKMSIGTEPLKRSITLATGEIAQPTRVSGITPGQNDVSGIVDMVCVVNAEGMGQDKVSYEKTGMDAEVKKDGDAAKESTATLGIANINPVLISTISYISKFIEKTTPLNYQERVSNSALNALRKKVGKQIVSGNPNATKPEICGIIKAEAITSASDLEIDKIDATTLRKIALGYGGDENLEGNCVLLLNKADLIAFGDIRGTNEKKPVYDIEFSKGSSTSGVIKDGGLAVNFVINSECAALSDTKTAAGAYTMLYGKALAYQLDLFSPYSVEVSRDYKFAEGMLAVLGEVLVGGNVIAYNGWTRIKKKAGA